MSAVIWNSLADARKGLKELHKQGKTIGSIHTLGALHIGHAQLIELSAKENECTVISIYPNVAQLAPGSKYEYDIDKDCKFAEEHGAHILYVLKQRKYILMILEHIWTKESAIKD